MGEDAKPIIADNSGAVGDKEWFALPSCPNCGGELFEGESESMRLDSNSGHDMLKDIDSGNRIMADIKVRRCQPCDYSKVCIEVYGYAGF